MREIADVLTSAGGSRAERLAAQRAFLRKRREIWRDIQEGKFPDTYFSTDGRKDNAKWKAEIESDRKA